MAWNMSKAKRQALVKLQLRDKDGRFIEMGGGVKWYSSRLKKVVAGTVVGSKGENALVRLNKENPTHEPALVSVPARSIKVVDSKATLSPNGEKGGPSADETPEFEKPEAVADVEADPNAEADSDHESQLKGPQHLAANYGITETPDGNTYITRTDGESIYSPARALKVGDELISPAGADPTKPFSIGRGWATKGTERLNKDGEGPVIGKVIAISENRYAVVQMAGGHTIEDRRNPGEQTDTVTVGLSNQVILATMGLKDSLGDRVSSQQYAERPDTEEKEVAVDAPEAQSDHVGREVPEDQLEAEPPVDRTEQQLEIARSLPVGGFVVADDGSQKFTKTASNQWQFSGGQQLIDDASMVRMVQRGEGEGKKYKAGTEDDGSSAPAAPVEAPAAESSEKKISDVSVEEMSQMPKGTVLRDPAGKLAYFVKEDGDKWTHHLSNGHASGTVSTSASVKNSDTFSNHTFAEPGTVPNATEAPESAPNAPEAPEAKATPDAPVEDAPEAPEEAPKADAPTEEAPAAPEEAPAVPEEAPEEAEPAKATPVNDIVEGLAELEQAAEDIEDSGLEDEEADDVLNGASFGVVGNDGKKLNVTAEKDENGDWNFVVADENGAEVASHVIGSEENRVLAEKIANGSAPKTEEAAPVEEAAPAAPEAEVYNENGLTAQEQAVVNAFPRMIERAERLGDFEKADRLSDQMAQMVLKGNERTAAGEGQSETPAEEPAKAPVSAPEPEKAPEVTPEPAKPVEDAPAPSLVEPDPAPEAPEKPLLNGEEGFVPIDGRGLKAKAKPGAFEISFEQRRDGLEHAVASRPEAFTSEEAEEFRKLDIELTWAQHENRSGREATVRGKLKSLNRRVQSRLDTEAMARHKNDGPAPVKDSVEKKAPETTKEAPKPAPPKAKEAPESAPEPAADPEIPEDSKDEPTPLTDEEMGDIRERLNGPSINSDGLLPDEAARLTDLETRLKNSYSPNHPYDEPVEPLEREVNELLEHGEARKRGDTVGPFEATQPVSGYNPAPEAAPEADVAPEQAPEVPEVAPEAPAAPAAPRTRARRGEVVPVADADGNMITRGDKVGHPTLGPVEIVNTIPGSGRVEFIDPSTGKKKSVKAANVRKIDPDAATPEAAPEAQSTTVSPGDRFVDPATGKKGFGDKDGNRVLVGDRVTDASGNEGTVVSVYTAANGGAWIPVKWDSDGKTRRVMGAQLTKSEGTTPEAAPEPFEVARPNAAPAPQAPSTENDGGFEPTLPSATPAPAPEAAPEAETFETATARRQRLVESTPVNTQIVSDDGTQHFYKISDTQWQFNEGSLLTPTAVVNMLALGENRGMKFSGSEGGPAKVNLPKPKAIPEAPATPESASPDDPNANTPGRRAQLLNRLLSLPIGTKIESRGGEQIFTKEGDDNWSSNVDPGSVLNAEDISNLLLRGRERGLRYDSTVPGSEPVAPLAPEAPAEIALDADSLVPPTVASRLEAFRRAPIGTTVTSPAGTSTYTKAGDDEWTNPDISGATIKNSTLAIATDSDNGYWVFNKTGPAEPEGTNVTAMGVSDRLRAFRMAPVGTKVTSTNGDEYTKVTSRLWLNQNGGEASAADLSYTVDGTRDNGVWGLTLPEDKAPAAIEDGTMLPRYNAEERRNMLTAAPIGTMAVAANSGTTYVKTADNFWAEQGGILKWNDSQFGLLTGSGTWALNPDGPKPPPAPRPIPQDLASRVRVSEESPIGTIVTSSTGESYTKISDELWADTATGNFTYRFGEFASKLKNNVYTGDYFVQGFDVPDIEPDAPTTTGTLSFDADARLAEINALPIGSTVEVGGYTYKKNDDGWGTSDDSRAVSPSDIVSAGNAWSPGVFTSPATAPNPMESDDLTTRTNFISSLPEGSTITHPRGREFRKVGPNNWLDNSDMEYEDHEVARTARPSEDRGSWISALPPEAPAAPADVIHDQLPVGTFLPSAEGATAGMKRVGDDKWEMVKDGQGTGRFVNDDTVKIFQELMGTSTVAPKAPEGDRFGNNVGMYAEDLGLPNGQSLGAFLENGGNYGDLSLSQKKKINAGYLRFIDNLNTLLPEGFSAKLVGGRASFGSSAMSTSVEFYKGTRPLGPAERIFRTSVDSRTNKRVSSVEHNYWRLADDVQGAGLSSIFLKASQQMYRQMGLDRITVHADISVGSYAWARSGFDFRSPHYLEDAMNKWEARYNELTPPRGRAAEWIEGKKEFDRLRALSTEENFMNGTHPPAIAFANIGRPTSGDTGPDAIWFGKDLLQHTHWWGDYMLNSNAPSDTVAPSA